MSHRFYPPRQSLHTIPRGKIIRKGRVVDARGLFNTENLGRFDQHWAEGLMALGSDFLYAERFRAKVPRP